MQDHIDTDSETGAALVSHLLGVTRARGETAVTAPASAVRAVGFVGVETVTASGRTVATVQVSQADAVALRRMVTARQWAPVVRAPRLTCTARARRGTTRARRSPRSARRGASCARASGDSGPPPGGSDGDPPPALLDPPRRGWPRARGRASSDVVRTQPAAAPELLPPGQLGRAPFRAVAR